MQIKIKSNMCSGIFSILTGIVLYILIPYCITAKRMIETSAIGSDYLPRLVAVLFCTIGAVMLIQSLVFKKDKTIVVNLDQEVRILVLMGILIAYAFLVKYTGFLITTIAALGLVLVVLKCRKWSYYLILSALTAFIHFSFRYGLNVRLP